MDEGTSGTDDSHVVLTSPKVKASFQWLEKENRQNPFWGCHFCSRRRHEAHYNAAPYTGKSVVPPALLSREVENLLLIA
jgi:hypothetical protein